MIDTHAHLTHAQVFPHLEGILSRAKAVGISKVVNICTDLETLARGIELQKNVPWVVNAAATTPHDVVTEGELNFPLIAEAARSGDLVAIGETGLDYYYEHSSPELQRHFLQKYLDLASECNLPVIFHCRDAFDDLFKLASPPRAILHCFTGTIEEAFQGIEKGWLISLSGILTFKKSIALRDTVRALPLEHLVLETDTPYLAPQSKRGTQNEPSFLPETARCLAELKGCSLEEVIQSTRENFLRMFNLSAPN
jgi:TatD DNase family protein